MHDRKKRSIAAPDYIDPEQYPDPYAARSNLGMTQEELARTMGVNRVTVAKWERLERKPSRMAFHFLIYLQELKMVEK